MTSRSFMRALVAMTVAVTLNAAGDGVASTASTALSTAQPTRTAVDPAGRFETAIPGPGQRAGQRVPFPSDPSLGPTGRRDLFAAPPENVHRPGPTPLPLAPVPSIGGGTLPPLPPGIAVPPPALAGAPAEAPLPHLVAVIIGPAPQAVLQSGDSYAIVHQGESTVWGRVMAIRPSAVELTTPSGLRTISWTAGGSK